MVTNGASAALTSDGDDLCDKLRGYTLSLVVEIDTGIANEGMYTAIPNDVDEADEVLGIEGADVTEAARQDGSIVVRRGIAPWRPPACVQIFAIEKWINDDA